ncbi:MAG: cupin domain-containing protein [Devosia sp.]|uniref:cupin domain-containing protein n=1 Tax=Devosia sp. TaxID=1871048 RepID=UPI001A00089C|nr:cupin domain-containing protein [Devosia sp.]MBF0680967.1 cupin domain-containing protein [Devosia sp.]
MVHVLPAANRPPGTSRTIRFEGEAYGTPVSFFAVDVAPGHGPVLHRHPYAETWIVLRGRAEVVAGDRVFPIGPGDVAVVPAETPHKFTAIGDERLEMTCIHAAGMMVQENLE